MATIYFVKQLDVQWQIGNECNFKCGYCHPDLYGGSNPFLTGERFDTAFNNLVDSTKDYDKVVVEFQGGEPTLNVSVRDRLAENNPRFKYIISSNGSADFAWWQQAMPNLEKLILSYHPMCDVVHFKSVVALAVDTGTDYSIVVSADPNNWAIAVSVYEDLKECGDVTLRPLFANYGKGNDKLLDYNEEQWIYLRTVNEIWTPVEEEPVEVQIHWVEDHLYNNYLGHLCWAGVDQIVIDYFGYVYRGWCHAYESFGNIFNDPVVLDAKPRVCPKTVCKNLFDQQARKSEEGWGLS